MGAKLEFIGANGNVINLFDNPYYGITNIDGFTVADVEVASSTTASIDGDVINNLRVTPRTVVLDLKVKNNVNVETAKRWLLQTVKPKLPGRIRMTQDGRETELSGIVENIEMPRFTNGVICQVSLHCSVPYWQDVNYVLVEISRLIDLHYFPKDQGGLAFPSGGIPLGSYNLNNTQTYYNDGDAETGMLITIIALGDVVNPIIYDVTGAYIGVIDTMTEGDVIEINTNRGEKYVRKNGENIFSKIKSGSSFLQLAIGDNQLTVNADSGTQNNMYFMITFKRRFV